jgi:hypothetical protein
MIGTLANPLRVENRRCLPCGDHGIEGMRGNRGTAVPDLREVLEQIGKNQTS